MHAKNQKKKTLLLLILEVRDLSLEEGIVFHNNVIK